PGFRLARISGRAARQRAGVPARQMEDCLAAHRGRLLDRRRRRRSGPSGCDADRLGAAVALGAGDALHRLGLPARRAAARDRLMATLKLVYFAWVRERIGKADEEITLPKDVATVADLLQWLAG